MVALLNLTSKVRLSRSQARTETPGLTFNLVQEESVFLRVSVCGRNPFRAASASSHGSGSEGVQTSGLTGWVRMSGLMTGGFKMSRLTGRVRISESIREVRSFGI